MGGMEFALSFMYIAIGLACLCVGISFAIVAIAVAAGRTFSRNTSWTTQVLRLADWKIYPNGRTVNEPVVHDKRRRRNGNKKAKPQHY